MMLKVSWFYIMPVVLVGTLLAAQPAAVLGQGKEKVPENGQGTAPVGTHTVPVVACTWTAEMVVVTDPLGDKKKKENVDKALKALVKALGAAASEVTAVKKAVDEIGPGNDQPDVKIVCACIDRAKLVIRRKEVPLPPNDEWLWSAKQNKKLDPKELDRQRDRATGDACRR